MKWPDKKFDEVTLAEKHRCEGWNEAIDACKSAYEQSKPAELCDTTKTPRLSQNACKDCGTYKDNLGPCETFCQGQNERCAYCDHELKCHPIAWHLIENIGTKPVPSVEDIQSS
jgi:hypothetical protein